MAAPARGRGAGGLCRARAAAAFGPRRTPIAGRATARHAGATGERDGEGTDRPLDVLELLFAQIGSRTTGNGGGHFMLAGPSSKGETPKGIAAVLRSETEFGWAFYRTQLFDPADLDNVKTVQAGYKVQTLSEFLGAPRHAAASKVDFVAPLTVEAQRESHEFFNVLSFVLTFYPTPPSETALRERFARLGIAGGKTFKRGDLPPEILQAVKVGMADAWAEFGAFKTKEVDTFKVASGDVFGTREFLKNNYLYRMAGAVLGIYGNSRQAAMYPIYFVDSAGAKLDGSTNAYALRFAPGGLPPVNSFWSLTVYGADGYMKSENNILNNSNVKLNADGTFTVVFGSKALCGDAPNRLDVTPGWNFLMRVHRPGPSVLDGSNVLPPVQTTR